MIASKLTFNDPMREVIFPGGADIIKRITKFFWDSVQTALRVPNTGVYVRGKKGRPGFTYYPNPSKPGEPPHKITGHGAGGVVYEFSPDGLTSRVGLLPNVIYMLYLEFGVAGGTTIYPRKKSVLSWVNNQGKRRFAKSVKQGHIAARPWLFGTLDKVMPQLRALAGG